MNNCNDNSPFFDAAINNNQQYGEVLYQSDCLPTYVPPRDTVAQQNVVITAEKTSDKYRTFDIPARFDNPDWWQGYGKNERNPLYRTTAQDYGAEKPNIHTMPTVYRAQSNAFTEHLSKCGIYRYQGLNTANSRSTSSPGGCPGSSKCSQLMKKKKSVKQ